MAAITSSSSRGGLNAISLALVVVFGLAVAIAILAVEEKAVVAVIGLVLVFFFLKRPVLGLYLTTALLLLSGMLGGLGIVPYGVPSTAAKACGAATIAAWVLNVLTTEKRFRFGREVFLPLAFAGWALVGIAFSLTWRVQLPEWNRLISVVIYFILAIHLLDTPQKLHRFVVVVLSCAFAMSLYAIAQYFIPRFQLAGVAGIESIAGGADMAFIDPEGTVSGAAVRVTGGTGHSNWLAFMLLLLLPLNVYWFTTMKSRHGKLLVLAAVGVELAALVLTFTRVSLIVGFVVALILVARSLVRLNPYRLSALAAALVVAWFFVPTAYKERVLDFSSYSESESTAARVDLQAYAWEYMQDFPVVGVGLGGFGLHFYEENSPYAAMLRWMNDELGFNPLYYGPHNMYLQLGSESGTVGLILMLLFFLMALLHALRAERKFRLLGEGQMATLAGAVSVSVLAFLLCAVFLHALQQKVWWMVFAVAVASYFCAARMAATGKNGVNGTNGVAATPTP
ncbi:MAG: O-antigen ligase family protein [Candidatus Hydrogenedentes bacterium]|nr:O-antigen ligase family protein [Candidatus Hydrogenedentota bacterium]